MVTESDCPRLEEPWCGCIRRKPPCRHLAAATRYSRKFPSRLVPNLETAALISGWLAAFHGRCGRPPRASGMRAWTPSGTGSGLCVRPASRTARSSCGSIQPRRQREKWRARRSAGPREALRARPHLDRNRRLDRATVPRRSEDLRRSRRNSPQDNQNDSVQAPGILRNETNLHVSPGRDTEHLYQLASGAKVAILKRATAEKQPGAAPSAKPVGKPNAKAPTGPVLEDWWLVRDDQSRVGWVLARMVDVDVPLDIAQYAEGQRFVAFFALNQVPDNEKGVQKQVPQYLAVLTDPHDGLPYDFDQVRVFTWNTRKHRYETAYREHGLDGVLPVTDYKREFRQGRDPAGLHSACERRCGKRQREEVQTQYTDRKKSAGARGSGLASRPRRGLIRGGARTSSLPNIIAFAPSRYRFPYRASLPQD